MFPDFLHEPVDVVAKKLLGCFLICDIEGKHVRVSIVETESYDSEDAASHSFKGKTARNEVMFGEPGRLYVYFTYGKHHCCNVVAEGTGRGAAVLIRAVEPLEGSEYLAELRGREGVGMTNGPGKLCQALGITMIMNNHDLRKYPLRLECDKNLKIPQIISTPRIGISKAKNLHRRHFIAGNKYVSR